MSKIIVLTGAGGVLCSTLAISLAEKGNKIAVLDLRKDAADKVAKEINNAGGKLRPGMFGTARIVLANSDSGVFVPITAVMTDETTLSSSVYIVKDGVARLTVVQIDEKEDDQIRIITGVGENETVATSNLTDLYDGATVVQ